MVEIIELDDDDENEARYLDLPVACTCPSCGDDIRLTEEVWMISFARAYSAPQVGVFFNDLTPAGAQVGTPWFFCFTCWEEMKEAMHDSCEDEPPMEVVSAYVLLSCDVCESDVLAGESFALETFGEIHWSKRCPNGQPTMVFEALSESKHICLSCIDNTEDNELFQIEVADDDDYNTCTIGKQLRCWRDRSRCIDCPQK